MQYRRAARSARRRRIRIVIPRQLPHARREAVRLVKSSYRSDEEAVDAIERELAGF
jgi:hypothetical protein